MEFQQLALIAAVGLALAFLPRLRVTAYALLVAAILVTAFEHTGKPRPLELEWREIGGTPVLDHWVDEPRAIYVLLAGRPPVFYAMPYSKDMHKKLVDAEGERGEEGFTVFEKSQGLWSPPAVSAERPFDDVRKEGQ